MNAKADNVSECHYTNVEPTWANAYLWPVLTDMIAKHRFPERRAFDLGCGNGATANMLSEFGFEVIGVDPSQSGIELARQSYTQVRFELGSTYNDLAVTYGTFPLVVSLEVIEHCLHPRHFAKTFFGLIAPRGIGIISTPYHGYWKNLALAVTGKWDAHLGPLWDGGHVKFFSIKTLHALLMEAGFRQISFIRVGRIPPLAKSMIALVRKP